MSEYVEGAISNILSGNGGTSKNNKLSSLFSKPDRLKLKKIPAKEEKKTVNKDEINAVDDKNVKRPRRDRQLKKRRNADQEKRTVFVGNIPKDVDKKELKKLFRKCGKVESIRYRCAIPENPKLPKKAAAINRKINEKRDSLNAYIVFENEESIPTALKLNTTILKNHQLRIDTSCKKQHDNKHSVFIGALPFDVKEETVRDTFQDCGQILNVRIIRDRKTGMGKGFGYILFNDKSSVELALKLDGSDCQGRKIRVQRAVKKQKEASKSKTNIKKDAKKIKNSSGDVKKRIKNTKVKAKTRK
ncbi:DgyrCDS9880 [Dimorphilus gyrociliatus]|uniref:DgyrCDS9880 n=1 Tax=Dimorphilus gyrociliatus TaxID=2664684 RepID=A0A7I8VYQ4_9ANNE|nr:DgyrCDS9880 [Dimorphilus gyrociliatus]